MTAEPRKDGPKVRRAINVLESQDEALRELSNITGITYSELVRRAIESMLTPRPEAMHG